MKAASAKEIKDDLKRRSQEELLEICLRLSRFKKENKELLTYLLFESDNELIYIDSIKMYMDDEFASLNKRTPYLMKKKIPRNTAPRTVPGIQYPFKPSVVKLVKSSFLL